MILVVIFVLQFFQKRFAEVQRRFEKYRSEANDLEPRLTRALRELRGVEEATCLLDLASDDPEGIQGQLNHCLVSLNPHLNEVANIQIFQRFIGSLFIRYVQRFYRTLSEVKGEVENIIKKGRQALEQETASNPDHFRKRLDMLKELYNKVNYLRLLLRQQVLRQKCNLT